MTKNVDYRVVAKVFWSGRSQAVRLPAACRFDTTEIDVIKEGDRRTLRPRGKNWTTYFDSGSRGSLPERRQPPLEERDESSRHHGGGRSSSLQCRPMIETRAPISPQAAARYEQRWAIARKRLAEELRATPMETRLRRLAALMESASEFGWTRSLDAEDELVRARWMALRRARLGKA